MIFARCSCFTVFKTEVSEDWQKYKTHQTNNNFRVHRITYQNHRAINFLIELEEHVSTKYNASRKRRQMVRSNRRHSSSN